MVDTDIEEFSFDKWYPSFVDIAIESIIITIPSDVLEYFREGDIVLPVEAVRETVKLGLTSQKQYTVDWDSVVGGPEMEQPSYPAFSSKLKDALNSLGGEAFVKMNWNAPKDAAWMTSNKSLKCTSLEDIYLILKGSDVVTEDINYEFQEAHPDRSRSRGSHCVVLKRWTDIHPGCEFRGFVRNRVLVAISQRDCGTHYKHIEANRYLILQDIKRFFRRKLTKKFCLPDYTFDIVRNDGSITLIDFNPFDEEKTDSLLFTWPEIKSKFSENDELDINTIEPEFRFLSEDTGLQPSPCRHARMPYEVEELCSRQRNMSLLDFLNTEVEEQNSSDALL